MMYHVLTLSGGLSVKSNTNTVTGSPLACGFKVHNVHTIEMLINVSHFFLSSVNGPDSLSDEAAVLLLDGVRQLMPLCLPHPITKVHADVLSTRTMLYPTFYLARAYAMGGAYSCWAWPDLHDR